MFWQSRDQKNQEIESQIFAVMAEDLEHYSRHHRITRRYQEVQPVKFVEDVISRCLRNGVGWS